MPTRNQIKDVLKRTYTDYYEKTPERFDDETRIYEHLHAEQPIGRGAVLDWLDQTAHVLGINERLFPIPSTNRDYTIGEIADIFEKTIEKQRALTQNI